MSAICGKYNRDNKPWSPQILEKMMTVMASYGRDAKDTRSLGPVTLGHLMTFDTPESLKEKLPANPVVFKKNKKKQEIIITSDARIDNRVELFNALNIHPSEYNKLPDSQIILLAYLKWGRSCPEKLLGDFAFAIWDSQKKELFCARSYPGTRAFYYHLTSKHFVFASNIDAILALPHISHSLDYEYLSAHLRTNGHFPHSERTFFSEIKKLPPAHAMAINPNEIEIWAYWEAGQSPEIRYKKADNYAEHLIEIYTKAINARVRSTFPVGAHISGGLDSSSIAVLASRTLQKNKKKLAGGFSWSPPLNEGEDYYENDERLRIMSIADAENFPYYFTDFSAQDVISHTFAKQTIPLSTAFSEKNIFHKAKSLGIRTLLSGWGGDELIAFNGHGFYLDMLRQGRLVTFFRELRMGNGKYRKNFKHRFLKNIILPWIPDDLIVRLRPEGDLAQLKMRRMDADLPLVFKNETENNIKNALNLSKRLVSDRLGVRKYQLALLENSHLTHRIEGWAKLGAKHGITYAYPLLDKRIVEFALGLPPDMFVKNGWRRWLFRYSLKGVLPDESRWGNPKADVAWLATSSTNYKIRKEQVTPFGNKILKEWLDSGKDFQLLDSAMVREAISPPSERKEVPQKPYKLSPALRIEQIVNPELDSFIQERIATTDTKKV